ncbi:MAG: hypothetical protein PF689_03925 [Deltaproteobacteria bacterium]|jgi:hypothetical protein|nr:hypothetical protein [Deltaproteobacteria bacterium]
MHKPVLLLIFLASLFTALLFRLFHIKLKQKHKYRGLSGKFWLATTIFALFFGCKTNSGKPADTSTSDKSNQQNITHSPKHSSDSNSTHQAKPDSHSDSTPESSQNKLGGSKNSGFIRAAKTVWRSFNWKQRDKFKNIVNKHVKAGNLDNKTGAKLITLFKEMAGVKRRTNSRVLCYKMTTKGSFVVSTEKKIYEQIEQIRKLKKKGAVDAKTFNTVLESLSLKIEKLNEARKISNTDYKKSRKEIAALKKKTIKPSPLTTKTAEKVMSLEGLKKK